ncbi:MAG: ATP-dependent Clp protease ATP-binding subunit [Gallicola sp.]|nr:ATP-dependent Clp protease ATP-binding subunit [Gallicola sp.]
MAARESLKLKHDYIGTEHILLAFFKMDNAETKALLNAGADYENLKAIIISSIGYGKSETPPTGFTPRVKRLLEMSREEAGKRGDQYVGSVHVLLALLRDEESFSAYMLKTTGVNKKKILEQLSSPNNKGSKKGAMKQEDSTIEKFSRNLNDLAREGKIDPVIGRNDEIERIIQVLLRRRKNNPVLIGEPGVGKTAIAEGLAQRIVEGEVPEIIADKELVSLDLAGMLAGTKYRGDFEERLKNTINELIEQENVVLFIDEFHTIVGAGGAEGAMDASNILKPVLAKGEIQMIGATTIDEYRKNIEKDAAMERRLQPIMVEEPTVEDTIKIIKGIRDKYEVHHKVMIMDEAITAAAELSHRYLPDRFLPDKAIDLIDEAASRVRMKFYISPPDMKELEDALEKKVEEKEQAVATQDFEKAAVIRDEIKKIKEELSEIQEEWDKEKKTKNMIVGEEEIAEIVSDWSNVPVTKLTEEESEKYLHLGEYLKERVIGQDQAVEEITHAIQRARVGLKEEGKPIGSFIFVGPTGVGKTYLAKSLAEELFGDEESMIRIDMSEYMEKHSVSKLIGSPPGYVGYDEGGQLTEAVRRKPYSVVLFDEIEKAHPDVFNMMLQILDDGRLTDSQGKTVDFKNTVVIMTSNVGATSLERTKSLGFNTSKDVEKEEYERNKEIINDELKNTFRPEFLNRVDDIIIFQNLNEKDVKKIAGLLLDEMIDRLESVDILAEYDNKLLAHISKTGFSKEYGARPLERVIRTSIENAMAEAILSGDISKEDHIQITLYRDKVKFKKIQAEDQEEGEDEKKNEG